MNIKQLVKLSNITAIIGIILLIYWVFAFILMMVFGLKIFRENLTEIFGMSIFGVLALLAGALMLNIMLNLTRIAERNETDKVVYKHGKKILALLVLLFPLIAGGLFLGDYLSSQKKKAYLIESAHTVISDQKTAFELLGQYQFNQTYIEELTSRIATLQRVNPDIRHITVIVPDTVEGMPTYLGFDGSAVSYGYDETQALANDKAAQAGDAIKITTTDGDNQTQVRYVHKRAFIFQADLREKAYLERTFAENSNQIDFSASDGTYKMFYPYQIDGKTVAVLYLSDYQRYGKYGS